jgi:hypothetical protein
VASCWPLQRDQLDGKWLRLWQTKNGAPRSVPLTERTQAILAERLPWTVKEHQIRYAWEKAKVAMGLSQDEDFVFHTLRHTRATRLVELGVNLRVIQQFMGHKAIQTTIRYAHVSNEMLVDAVSRMERVHPTNPVGGVLPRASTPRPAPSQSRFRARTVGVTLGAIGVALKGLPLSQRPPMGLYVDVSEMEDMAYKGPVRDRHYAVIIAERRGMRSCGTQQEAATVI